jgi:UDP-N-acetylmuramyl-tripeptide synthetase
VAAAAAQGAVACVVEREQPFPGTQVRVRSSREALGQVAANAFGRPAEKLSLVAVTGTNGKTTTTYLVESALRHLGLRPGVIGTVNYRYADQVRPAPYTTPTALELQAMLSEMADAGVSHVVLEASSHALALGRLAGVSFEVGAFSNLTQDHLDLHGTMEAYRQAKTRLFAEHLAVAGAAVVNVDDKAAAAMLAATPATRHIRCSAEGRPAEVRVTRALYSIEGVEAAVDVGLRSLRVRSPLLGAHNLANIVLALGICHGLGLDPAGALAGIEKLLSVPGRLERVAGAGELVVLVDYAHTPDALWRAMAALRPLCQGRLIVVFGCGGDRDRGKRPLMGEAVARGSDLAVVTSDNPRSEEPQAIIDQILIGVRKVASPEVVQTALSPHSRGHVVIADRRAAIGAAVACAAAGDVVLLAGKGHEDYQLIGTTRIHFDDREEAAAALAGRQSRQAATPGPPPCPAGGT